MTIKPIKLEWKIETENSHITLDATPEEIENWITTNLKLNKEWFEVTSEEIEYVTATPPVMILKKNLFEHTTTIFIDKYPIWLKDKLKF